LFVVVYLRLQRQRRQAAANLGTLGIVRVPGGRPLGARRHLPAVLFLAGLTILLVALARPQAVVSLPKMVGTVVLAFDVSGSMAADDLQPTRMEAAKAAAREFVERQPATVQIGVVAFSDSGLAVQPPTNDQATVLAAINRLRPERGTSLAHGVVTALNTIFAEDEESTGERRYSDLPVSPTPTPTPMPEGSYAPAAIVLFTDGENTAPPDPGEAVQAASDRGVRIYTVGIGSPQGTTLEVEGFMVHTQLDERALQYIAEETGGAYYNATSEENLREVYTSLEPELVVEPEEMEITALLAGASVLVWLVGGLYSLLWFGRLP
jgi:Ca-activated chloride channel family protein